MLSLATTVKAAHTPVQWSTLAWFASAVLAATLIIVILVVVSRRPKSIEDGIADFSRSLQAVAPSHRPGQPPVPAQPRPTSAKAQEEHTVRATKGETEAV
jgi:cytoskeletal protein RodZ